MAGNSGSGKLSWQSFQGEIRRGLELSFIPSCHQVPDCPFLQEGKVLLPICQFRMIRRCETLRDNQYELQKDVNPQIFGELP